MMAETQKANIQKRVTELDTLEAASVRYFRENLRLREIIDAMTDAMDNVSILTPVNDDGWRECIFCGHGWRVSRGEQHHGDCALSLAKKAMQDPNLGMGGQG